MDIFNTRIFSCFLAFLLCINTAFVSAEDIEVETPPEKMDWSDARNKIPASIYIYSFEDDILKPLSTEQSADQTADREFILSMYQLESENQYYVLKEQISPVEDTRLRSIFQTIGYIPPLDVEVGIYISKLYNLSFPDNEINAEFYLWFNHRNDRPNAANNDIPAKNFSLMNSKEYTQIVEPYERWLDSKKEISHWGMKANAIIIKNWDTENFPFDKHRVEILIEGEYDINCFNYVPDTKESMIYDKVKLNGWEIKDFKVEADREALDCGWGYHGFYRYSPFPRFIASFTLVRDGGGWGTFMKIFSGLLIAFLMCFVSMLIKADYIDAKFALSIGALFIVLASQYIVSSVLPDTPSQTFADIVHNISYIFIFLIVVESIFTKYLFDKEKEELAHKIDIISLIILVIGLVLSIVPLTINALIS